MGILARDVLWHLIFWGFAVNYMVRINLSIAIVSMVRSRRADVSAKESECFVAVSENTSHVDNSSSSLMTRGHEDAFPWDEYQQSLVLGAFFWLHWVLTIPGGVMAQKFGTKIVFGMGNLLMCLLSLLIPVLSRLDYRALVVLRVLQGLIGGVCWPSMHNMATSWIPPNERSKFFTAYLGSSVGAGLTFPMCGLIIDHFDWPAAFYATGLIGVGWFIVWWFLVFDSPAQHPRIDPAERQHIEDSLGNTVLKKKRAIPWRCILTSKHVWYTVLAHVGGLWGLFILLIQGPTYLKFIHGWDVRMAGFLSGMPHFCRVLFAIVFSTVGDGLLRRKVVTRPMLRKFAAVVSTIGQGLCIVGLAFCGCNWLAAILFVTLAITLHGAVSTGTLANFADLSPNYASITFGICGLIGVIPGFLSPLLVGAFTYQNQTIGQWQQVFLISVVIVVAPGLLFLFFGSSAVQPWNHPREEAAAGAGEELQSFRENLKRVVERDARRNDNGENHEVVKLTKGNIVN